MTINRVISRVSKIGELLIIRVIEELTTDKI